MVATQWCCTVGLLLLLKNQWSEASHGKMTFKEKKLLRPPRTQKQFIRELRRLGFIKSDIVYKTMYEIDRKHYVGQNPYVDIPMMVPYLRQLDNPPHMHAFALEVLKKRLKHGHRALDVGCGFGYLTACMSMMVRYPGLVVCLDTNLRQIQAANRSFYTDKYLQEYYVEGVFVVGELAKGYPDLGPYDAIFVTPAAVEVPQALLEQLSDGGRMVIPIGNAGDLKYLKIYDKDRSGLISVSEVKGDFCARRSIYPTPLENIDLYSYIEDES